MIILSLVRISRNIFGYIIFLQFLMIVLGRILLDLSNKLLFSNTGKITKVLFGIRDVVMKIFMTFRKNHVLRHNLPL